MKNHEGDIKAFTQLSKAWYGPANLNCSNIRDSVTFGFYAPEGGTSGEISVDWISLSGNIVPEMRIFSDSWSALSNMHDLIDLLGTHDDEDSSPEEFCEFLLQCGFVDKTETKSQKYTTTEIDNEYEEYIRLKNKFEK